MIVAAHINAQLERKICSWMDMLGNGFPGMCVGVCVCVCVSDVAPCNWSQRQSWLLAGKWMGSIQYLLLYPSIIRLHARTRQPCLFYLHQQQNHIRWQTKTEQKTKQWSGSKIDLSETEEMEKENFTDRFVPLPLPWNPCSIVVCTRTRLSNPMILFRSNQSFFPVCCIIIILLLFIFTQYTVYKHIGRYSDIR